MSGLQQSPVAALSAFNRFAFLAREGLAHPLQKSLRKARSSGLLSSLCGSWSAPRE